MVLDLSSFSSASLPTWPFGVPEARPAGFFALCQRGCPRTDEACSGHPSLFEAAALRTARASYPSSEDLVRKFGPNCKDRRRSRHLGRSPVELSGSQILMQFLKDEGVEYIFGYPGGAVLHIYDEIYAQDDVKHILVRHEQGATHMADGYARATGKPGVVLVTSGPGATNAVTGIADRAHGLGADGGHHRPGPDPRHWQRCVPGGRLRGHHASLREAQFPREGPARPRRHAQEGVLRRDHRAAGTGGGRHPQGRDRAQRQDTVRVSDQREDAVLQSGGAGTPGADEAGARPDPVREAPDDLHRGRRRARRPRRTSWSASPARSATPSPTP